MKVLDDGTKVPSRIYYYLLDWNDQDNWKYVTTFFDKTKLHTLTAEQFKELFKHATIIDLNNNI